MDSQFLAQATELGTNQGKQDAYDALLVLPDMLRDWTDPDAPNNIAANMPQPLSGEFADQWTPRSLAGAPHITRRAPRQARNPLGRRQPRRTAVICSPETR